MALPMPTTSKEVVMETPLLLMEGGERGWEYSRRGRPGNPARSARPCHRGRAVPWQPRGLAKTGPPPHRSTGRPPAAVLATGPESFPMLIALTRAFGQLDDPHVRRILWRSIGITLALVVLVAAGAAYGLDRIDFTRTPPLQAAIDVLGGLGVVIVAFLFFPALVGVVASFFLEDVAEAVASRHYAALPTARSPTVFK